MDLTLFVSFILSASLNILLFFLWGKAKSKPSQNPLKQSEDLKAFIADLMHGKLGMIAIARVDPNDILLRSPRQDQR